MHRVIRFAFLPLALLFVFGTSARAQDDEIKLKADLVTVTAAVRDRNQRPVKSLKAEDFAVYEDGVRQKITHFAATEEPFSLLLLLDISGSTRDDIALIKRAARNFLTELRKEDRVGVIVFSGEVELIAEFSDKRSEVEAAIEAIATPGQEGDHRFNKKTGTSFYDALFLAVEDGPLGRVEGRKAIVCMSDGVDSTSKMDYRSVALMVEKSEASVYFLELNTEEATLANLLLPQTDPGYVNFSQSQINRYYDEFDRTSPNRFRHRKSLDAETLREINKGLYEIARRDQVNLAERTGGRVYPVRALGDLAGVYSQVADDLRSQYSIGYYPENDEADGRWRSIRVEVRAPGTTVRSRSGYWAK
ncbi:MAG TPA: VWA domain-containing protein [Blastocatellia bacterium]|nr:VWA domain-containing protein [Blastocatellia bacterium]